MRLAHGLYYSRRRQQYRAVWLGRPFAYGRLQEVKQCEGAFREYIARLLFRYLDTSPLGKRAREIAISFACSPIKQQIKRYGQLKD